ncbi:RpiB/LacA/LacB family sugar-phosphate isomerase [Inquilinus sp. KBS0705]|nr:RpiB/LacA/LacB family sugar-phosphate isomerase [Inquilinus sp. KBS0705]
MKKGLNIAIGADHAGFEYKEALKTIFADDINFKDFGTYSADSADYPDFAHPVASGVENGEFDFGILLCGSANGVAMTANKHQNIRAAICWRHELAIPARTHNNANVLCLPARHMSIDEAKKTIEVFLTEEFEGGRHATRVNKISC